MSFVDASVVVAILNEEPGFEELEKRLNDAESQLYVSPMVRFEAVAALSRLQVTVAKGKVDREHVISEARGLVDEFIQTIQAKEVVIDARAGAAALEAMARYGKVAGHPAALNLGDCFAYASAKTYRLPLIYKINDFSHVNWHHRTTPRRKSEFNNLRCRSASGPLADSQPGRHVREAAALPCPSFRALM